MAPMNIPLPEEAFPFRLAIEEAIRSFESWGYEYLKLPFFESFNDRSIAMGELEPLGILKVGDELLSLRSDFTLQTIRAVSRFRELKLPLRIYYLGTVFRNETDVEQLHTGVEMLGSSSVLAEAEVIAVIYEYLKNLGLSNLTVSVGHVGIVEKLMEEVEPNLREEIKRAFKEKNLTYLRSLFGRKSPKARLPLLQGGDEVLEELKNLNMEEEAGRLKELGKLLKSLKVDFIYDLVEVRDQPYYTGVVFEIFHPALGYPLAGGGRYDRLPSSFGLEVPAVGGGVYLNRVVKLLGRGCRERDFFIVPLYKEEGRLLDLISFLRSKNFSFGVEVIDRPLEESLEFAFSRCYKKVILIREDGLFEMDREGNLKPFEYEGQ